MLYRRYALGNDEFRHLGQFLAEGTLNLSVGLGIAGRGGVVEHQHLRSLQQGAGNAETLLLTARDVGAALFDAGVVAVGHLVDKLVGAGQTACLAAVVERCVGFAPAQVLKHRPREERILLQHDGHLIAQRRQVVLLDITPTDEHLALPHVV